MGLCARRLLTDPLPVTIGMWQPGCGHLSPCVALPATRQPTSTARSSRVEQARTRAITTPPCTAQRTIGAQAASRCVLCCDHSQAGGLQGWQHWSYEIGPTAHTAPQLRSSLCGASSAQAFPPCPQTTANMPEPTASRTSCGSPWASNFKPQAGLVCELHAHSAQEARPGAVRLHVPRPKTHRQ